MMLGSKEQRTEGMRRQAQELIDQAYERGFKAGRESEAIAIQEGHYQRGLDDAWEATRKIINNVVPWEEWKLAIGVSTDYVFKIYSASEAIEKIKAYEEKKKADEEDADNIKVGDEVKHYADGTKAVVLDFVDDGERVMIFDKNGNAEDWELSKVRKTGRSFPQILEVLEKLKEVE